MACLSKKYLLTFPTKATPKSSEYREKLERIKNQTMSINVHFNGTAQHGWIPQHPPKLVVPEPYFYFQMEIYKGGRILHTTLIHSISQVPSVRRSCYGITVFKIFYGSLYSKFSWCMDFVMCTWWFQKQSQMCWDPHARTFRLFWTMENRHPYLLFFSSWNNILFNLFLPRSMVCKVV